MRSLLLTVSCGIAVAGLLLVTPALSQEETGERVGGNIGRAIGSAVGELREEAGQLASDIRQGFEKAKAAVDRMSVEARVYARLHWDKHLYNADLAVDVQKDGAAVLTGTVADNDGKLKAGQLAQDTVGVERVVNNIRVLPATR